MNISTPHARARLTVGALLLATILLAAPAAAAPHPHSGHGAPLPSATTLRRGNPGAEAAVDALTRAMSREHGYRPGSFHVELYSVPVRDADVIVPAVTATRAGAGWAESPELTMTGAAFTAAGWERQDGGGALVAGYGPGAADGRMFLALIQATR